MNDPGSKRPNSGPPPWSRNGVVRAAHCPRAFPALSWTGYLRELFDDDSLRIEHPETIRQRLDPIAPPRRVRIGTKWYFVPGSITDYLSYYSSITACLPAIYKAWLEHGTSEDCGPPSQPELQSGEMGNARWAAYWNLMHENVSASPRNGLEYVLQADVRSMASSMERKRLLRRLASIKCDDSALYVLDRLMASWEKHGHSGIPVTGSFSLMNRVYMMPLEDQLRQHGFIFYRVLDDFRILCKGPEEKEQALDALRESLFSVGLRLNDSKTKFYRIGDPSARRMRRALVMRGKLAMDARPVLVRALHWPVARPPVLKALDLLNGLQNKD